MSNVLFALVAAPLLVAIVALAVVGDGMAAGLGLVVFLLARVSEVGVALHRWPSTAVVLVLIVGGATLVRRRRPGPIEGAERPVFWCAAGTYLAVVLASSIWAGHGSVSVTQAKDLAKNLVIVWVVARLFETRHAQRRLLWAFVGTGASLAALSVLQFVTNTDTSSYLGFAQAHVQQIVGSHSDYRSAGPIGDANFFGLFLASLVPMAGSLVRHETRRGSRAVAATCLALLLAGVALTYSRGAVLALACGVVILLALDRPRAGVAIVGALMLGAATAVFVPLYVQRISSAVAGDRSIKGHRDSERVALALLADHPLVGVGADNYQFVYRPYALRNHAIDAASTVHDNYLAIAAETGLVGLSAFGASMWFALGAGSRRVAALRADDGEGADDDVGVVSAGVAGLGAYLIGSAFLPLAYTRNLWLLVAFVLAVCTGIDRASPH